MSESGYYPPGVEHDPNAPWNQIELPEKEFKVTVTYSVDKEVIVSSTDYGMEKDCDEDGSYVSIDTSNTNWIAAYQEQHESIEDLLCAFKEMLEEKISTETNKMKLNRLEYLKSECEGWVTHDFEVVE